MTRCFETQSTSSFLLPSKFSFASFDLNFDVSPGVFCFVGVFGILLKGLGFLGFSRSFGQVFEKVGSERRERERERETEKRERES